MLNCEKCGKEHDGSIGSGRFCSRSCANSHIPTPEHREKTSKSLKGKLFPEKIFKDKDKWRQSLTAAHRRRREQRATEVLTLPFSDLTYEEQKTKIFNEQNGICKLCSIPPIWNNKKLNFDCDHIDGNSKNHIRENLRMICPNCHSQTPTYKKNNSDIKVTDEEYKAALLSNPSIYKALLTLGVRMNGGAYRRARRIIKEFSIQMETGV